MQKKRRKMKLKKVGNGGKNRCVPSQFTKIRSNSDKTLNINTNVFKY